MNGFWPWVHPDHRERAILEHRHDPIGDPVEVVEVVTLAGAGALEQRLVEVCQVDAIAGLVDARLGHRRTLRAEFP